MVAEANDKFRPLSNAVHCYMLLLTLLADPHLENIIHLVMGRKCITVYTLFASQKLNPVIIVKTFKNFS